MNLVPIEHKQERILTTQQLAEAYGTDTANISKNFSRNQSRYAEGKHFYKLEGAELQAFKTAYGQNDDNLKFAPALYLWTEKGAWMHAKSLNTDEAWNAYEMLVDDYYRVKEARRTALVDDNQRQRLQIRDRYSRVAEGKLYLAIAKTFEPYLSNEGMQTLAAITTAVVSGTPVLPLPQVEKTYTATEIGQEVGLSSNRIGRIAKEHNLKIPEYGITVLDKARHSDKQIPAFRYNEAGRDAILRIVAQNGLS